MCPPPGPHKSNMQDLASPSKQSELAIWNPQEAVLEPLDRAISSRNLHQTPSQPSRDIRNQKNIRIPGIHPVHLSTQQVSFKRGRWQGAEPLSSIRRTHQGWRRAGIGFGFSDSGSLDAPSPCRWPLPKIAERIHQESDPSNNCRKPPKVAPMGNQWHPKSNQKSMR
jgi:hypothetical protein